MACNSRGVCTRNTFKGRGLPANDIAVQREAARAQLAAANAPISRSHLLSPPPANSSVPTPLPTPASKPMIPTPASAPAPGEGDMWARHRGKPLPTIPGNPLENLSTSGPQFTQRNITIPQPNSLEAFQYGTPGHVQQFPRFAPEQESAMRSLLEGGLGGLAQTNLNFEPIAERARKQFNEQTIPGLAERFTALGGQRSSAFKNALGQAGADLESQLANLGSQYNLQKFGALRGLAQLGLEPSYETAYFPAQPGALQSFAQEGAKAIPAAADLAAKGIGGAISSWWTGGGKEKAAEATTKEGAATVASEIANEVPKEVAKAATSKGFEYFKNAIWPTLVGATGGALGTFPLLPFAVFLALGGGLAGLMYWLHS